MLQKAEIQDILVQALKMGADFAELFFENNVSKILSINNNDILSYKYTNNYGVGIRLFKNENESYIYTNKVNYQYIIDLISQHKKYLNENKKEISVVPLKNPKPFQNNIKKAFNSLKIQDKADKIIKLSKIIHNYNPNLVSNVNIIFTEREQKVLIANSKGIYQNDVRPYIKCDFFVNAADKKNNNIQSTYYELGYSMGLEFFDLIDLKKIAEKTARKAIDLLFAQEIETQIMPVIIGNGSGGTLFHEACGHSLESYCISDLDKLNTPITSNLVTAYDDGTMQNAWGKLNFDDEGMPTQKNLLIEKGILKNYLVDFKDSIRLKTKPTGSARRESYKFMPMARMNCTYIAAGKDDPQQIIKDTEYGLYAEEVGGGSVYTDTGDFNFMINSGYLIEKGKITKPVKEMMLIGNSKDILFKIDRIGNDLTFYSSYCGSYSGYIPINLGQPTVRIKSMKIRGNKK